MVGTDYAKKEYPGLITYQKIAKLAFNAGKKEAEPKDVKKLKEELASVRQELASVRQELKSLWQTIESPEEFVELLAGM